MSFLAAILCFLIGVAAQGVVIWVATKIVRLDCTFREAVIMAVICNLLLLIPKVGFILSAIAFFALLIKWIEADVLDAVLMSVTIGLLQMLLLWAML